MGKLRLKEAKSAISSFGKLAGDHEKIVDLMLYYVEMGTQYTLMYGDIYDAFYDSMLSMYEKVADACNQDEALYRAFHDRLYAVVEATEEIGWGYHECLCDCYYSIDWVWDEE